MTQTDSDFSSFGALLKTFRKRQHLTQQQLTENIGVHRSTLINWEQGTFLPESKTMVLELARHLHLDDQETRQLLETSLTALAPHWSVPFPRNPYFTGREAVLEALHAQLGADQRVALTQSSALHGLGGVGKTQIALEYAYRYALEYRAVFCIGAETEEQIVSSFLRIAEVLRLPEREDTDQQRVVAAVQRWLSTHLQWLLVWDNVEDLESLRRFLPAARSGVLLFTTRLRVLGALARGLDLWPMEQEEALLFLLRRARVLSSEASREDLQDFAGRMPAPYAAAAELVTALGGLPLALDQAGAYLEATQCGLLAYRELFETQRSALLKLRGEGAQDHPASVSTTFHLSLVVTTQRHPAVEDLLRVCALVQPDAIPEELFQQGAQHLGPTLGAVCRDQLEWNQVVAAACSSSLLSRQAEEQTLSIHRLVQAVLLDAMTGEEQEQWVQRTIEALNVVFPEVLYVTEYVTWKQCERLLPHVLQCLRRADADSESLSLASLAYKTSCYLLRRGLYAEAEQFARRALQLWEQVHGSKHLDVASSLSNLADLYWRQGKYAEAEPLYLRALHIREQILGPDHPEVAIYLSNLANLYFEQSKYTEAELLYLRALHIWEQALGADHPDIAFLFNNLAAVYFEQGQHTKAEAFYLRALCLWEQALGPNHPQLPEPLTGLANLYREQGRYIEAKPLYQRALSICDQQLGSQHPHAAETLYSLAHFHQRQNNLSEALSYAERSLSIRSRALGEAHPKTVAVRTLYNQLLREQADGQVEKASQGDSQELPDPRDEEHHAYNTSFPLRKENAVASPQNDPLQEFLDACCELHPLAWCRSADLWGVYQQWVEQHQERYPLSRRALSVQLKAHGCRADRLPTARIWRGIALVKQER